MIPKSLHTVTALVNVARLHTRFGNSPELSMAAALECLGYKGAPDPYGLAARALALLKAQVRL